MALANPYGYSITDATNAWISAGNVFEAKTDDTARAEADQKTYAAAGFADQVAFALEELRQVLNGALDIPGPVIINGNLTLDAAAAVHTIGSASSPGSPSTHAEVSATGTYTIEVDDGTNSNDGGWRYDCNSNVNVFRANNADRIYIGGGANELRAVTDSEMTLGTTGSRWSNFFTDAMTCGGNATFEGSSAIITLGNPSTPAQPVLNVELGATSEYQVNVDDQTNARDGGWWYSANSNAFAVRAANADNTYFTGGAVYPATDSTLSLGITSNRWSDFFTDAMTCGGAVAFGSSVAHTTTVTVGAAATADWKVHDGTNAFDGGWRYDTNIDQLDIYAANASRMVLTASLLYPTTDSQISLGATANRFSAFFSDAITCGGAFTYTSTTHREGAGTPEGVVTAAVGSTFHRTDGGAGTCLYVKESGAGNTGWVAK